MKELLVRNENIQRLFSWYKQDLFIVNRKYQRKLVWTLEEKQKFINSISNDYPVPLFLLAESNDKYEIIDGMQRLEAIFSFLQGEYIVKTETGEGYFDLETMPETKEMLDNGLLFQNHPTLHREVCRNIANYQIPLSITPFEDSQIEEIFRRINATGRQLSSQDLRQAGTIGSFSNIVRIISTQIRRDSSDDILPLSKMRKISLASNKLNYGINLSEVFWVKHQIVTFAIMRLSRDEELISYLLIYILLGADISPTAHNLDIIYGFEEEDRFLLRQKINSAIKRDGEQEIISRFMSVFDEFECLLAETKGFSQLIFNDDAHGKGRSFQVIFLAFYNLLTSGHKIGDIQGLRNVLSGIGQREFGDISTDKWKASYRKEKVLAIQGIIKSFFIESDSFDPAKDNWISRLENILTQSTIEQQLFDFKIGFHDLSNGRENIKCISKIVKTLTAMANTEKNAVGYVLVGIADKESDANLHNEAYNTEAHKFQSFYVTGIDAEANKYYKSNDAYFNLIKQKIEQEPIDENTKSYITRHMMPVKYYSKTVMVLTLKNNGKPILYDKKYYERRGANNAYIDEELLMTDMSDFMSRFL